jgi:CPA1 family monovalent cation:H+ antiporter
LWYSCCGAHRVLRGDRDRRAVPSLTVEEQIRAQVLDFEFSGAVAEGMLGLLLFCWRARKTFRTFIESLACHLLDGDNGCGASTAIVGFSSVGSRDAVDDCVRVRRRALISPTDPVAVLGVLR